SATAGESDSHGAIACSSRAEADAGYRSPRRHIRSPHRAGTAAVVAERTARGIAANFLQNRNPLDRLDAIGRPRGNLGNSYGQIARMQIAAVIHSRAGGSICRVLE